MLQHPQPILNKFDFNTADALDIEKELFDALEQNKAISVCASQLGLNHRAFALDGGFIFFNPKLLAVSDEEVLLEETDIAYPNFSVKIKRPKNIRVRYQRSDGEAFTHPFTGMTARYIQHCLNILDGENWTLKANLYHREKAFSKWKKI